MQPRMKLEGKNILLVEDDSFIGEMVARSLKTAGADYSWARNEEEWLRKMEDKNFDAVVTDLVMAKTDGREIIKKMKSSEKTKNVPIIVFTDLTGSDRDVEDIESLGVDGLYVKSNNSLDDFVNKVVEVLEEKSK